MISMPASFLQVRDVFQHGENASLNEKHIQIMLLQKALKGPNTHKDPRTI